MSTDTSVQEPATLSVWFMFDNHTFKCLGRFPADSVEELYQNARTRFFENGCGSVFFKWSDRPKGEGPQLPPSLNGRPVPKLEANKAPWPFDNDGEGEWIGNTWGVTEKALRDSLVAAECCYTAYSDKPPALTSTPTGLLDVHGPEGSCLRDFHEDSWWVPELKSMLDLPGVTDDQKRAFAVVSNLLKTIRAAEDYEKTHKA